MVYNIDINDILELDYRICDCRIVNPKTASDAYSVSIGFNYKSKLTKGKRKGVEVFVASSKELIFIRIKDFFETKVIGIDIV